MTGDVTSGEVELSERRIFKTLVTIDDANRLLSQYFKPRPTGVEHVSLNEASGHVLAEDVVSNLDVPGFDRATMDGYAVKAQDTFGASDDHPASLKIVGQVEPGDSPPISVSEGEAVEIATGAPLPQGANSVIIVENTQKLSDHLRAFRSVVPGENVMAAGSDIMNGELIIRRGERATPREVGLLAALGIDSVKVYRKPRVAIISTGNELTPPGFPLGFGKIYDINASTLSALVSENGGIPQIFGIVTDDPVKMEAMLQASLCGSDLVLTSGSTSAGVGDLLYRIVDRLGKPGILVHGLSVKPGKPTIIAVVDGKPLFGLPGYPTSALMIFLALVAPVLRMMAGLQPEEKVTVEARVPFKVFSAKGRRELMPVHLTRDESGAYLVYPATEGSGAISTFALSDGFIDIPAGQEFLEEGEYAQVELFARRLKPADLFVIGSHCVGMDILLQVMLDSGARYSSKIINVGSMGGIHAVKRREADIAGIHLLDDRTGQYNIPYIEKMGLKGQAVLVRGYNREQGLIVAEGNPRGIKGVEDIISGEVRFLNRNTGSGTRSLLDSLLKRLAVKKNVSFQEAASRIRGYEIEAKSHSAVAAAVKTGNVDVGIGIRTVAVVNQLGFIHLADEKYDFLLPKGRVEKEPVRRFVETLRSPDFHSALEKKAPGLRVTEETGSIILN